MTQAAEAPQTRSAEALAEVAKTAGPLAQARMTLKGELTALEERLHKEGSRGASAQRRLDKMHSLAGERAADADEHAFTKWRASARRIQTEVDTAHEIEATLSGAIEAKRREIDATTRRIQGVLNGFLARGQEELDSTIDRLFGEMLTELHAHLSVAETVIAEYGATNASWARDKAIRRFRESIGAGMERRLPRALARRKSVPEHGTGGKEVPHPDQASEDSRKSGQIKT